MNKSKALKDLKYSNKKLEPKKETLIYILNDIEENINSNTWECSAELIFDTLEVSRSDFVKFCYINQFENPDFGNGLNETFNPETIFELIKFLEELGYKDTENLFFKKGFYLNAENGALCLEYFHALANSFFDLHIIDRELLEISIIACKKLEDAFDFYCDNIFELNTFISNFNEFYFKKSGMAKHDYSIHLISEFIKNQFGHHSFFEEIFYNEFKKKLKSKAIEWEQIEFQEEEINLNHKSSSITLEIKNALQTLNLQSHVKYLTKEILRKKYCECLKEYHPDIKKSNKKKDVREIIAAYNLILCNLKNKNGIEIN